MTSTYRTRQPYGELGGQEYDPVTFKEEKLRADLCMIANAIDYRVGAKIVDAILDEYTVTSKYTVVQKATRRKNTKKEAEQ